MGKASPTIYDVAALAQVSVATISRHINGTARLEDGTRERVEAAIAELGFVPNSSAQRLSSGKSMIVGLAFLKDFVNDNISGVERESMLFFDTVLRGIEVALSAQNYSVLISFVDDDFEHRVEALQRMVGTVDGIIALESVITPEIVTLFEKRLPIVVLAGDVSTEISDNVHSANDGAMYEIAEHLVRTHGVRTAGFLNGRLRSPDARNRRDAFSTRFRELGGTIAEHDILEGDWSVVSGEYAMRDRIATGIPLPEALVCANDQMAVGALGVAVAHGVRVPDELKFTGFDDTPMSQLVQPSLTTIRQDTFGMGKAAVGLLLDAIATPQRPKQSVAQPTTLVLRRSCGCTEGESVRTVKELVAS